MSAVFQLGFDIGGTKIAAGVVDDGHRIHARREVPFPKGRPYTDVVTVLAGMASELAKETGIERKDFRSIGLSVPGSIGPDGATVLHAYNLQFHDVPLKAAVEAALPGPPVYLANDANAAALAELCAGVFRGCRTAVLLTLGTGVGGGLILNGRMFNGGLANGVELGHMCLQYGGPRCTCGNRGCIETLCSATWLARQGRLSAGRHPGSEIAKKALGVKGRVDAKIVLDAAKEGDAVALEIVGRYIDQLAAAVISCANLLDPEVIALGGGISRAGEFLLAPLRDRVENGSFFRHPYRIVAASMGNDAGIVGVAMLANNGTGA